MIVVDIDGTLVDGLGVVSPATRDCLTRAHAAGIPVVLATGRHQQETDAVRAQLPFPVYVISSNGAVTRDPSSAVLHRQALSESLVEELLTALLPHVAFASVRFVSTERGPAVVAVYEPAARALLQRSGVTEVVIHHDFEACRRAWPEAHAVQVTLHDRADTDRTRRQGFLLQRFVPQVAISRLQFPGEESYLWEVNGAQATKGGALERLCGSLGVSLGEVVAIGDNWNDLSMLQVAGRPFLMANAPEDLRRSFGFKVTASHLADGVREAVLSVWPHLG